MYIHGSRPYLCILCIYSSRIRVGGRRGTEYLNEEHILILNELREGVKKIIVADMFVNERGGGVNTLSATIYIFFL